MRSNGVMQFSVVRAEMPRDIQEDRYGSSSTVTLGRR
jgi:hypothetical protein